MSRCGFSVPAVPKCVHFELTPLTINEEYQRVIILYYFLKITKLIPLLRDD